MENKDENKDENQWDKFMRSSKNNENWFEEFMKSLKTIQSFKLTTVKYIDNNKVVSHVFIGNSEIKALRIFLN